MRKELQDQAWAALPKEFKEVVKKYYKTVEKSCKFHDKLKNEEEYHLVLGKMVLLEDLFGFHNLTELEGKEKYNEEDNVQR